MKSLRRFRALFRKKQLDADMAEEMRAHLELQAERNRAAGMSADEAHYAAQRQFGNVASIQERAREGRGWVWLEQGWQDVRYTARQLRRSPAFATAVVGTMALGIGASTALFSVVNGVLLRPLPFPDADRVVMLSETHPVTGRTRVAPAVYLDWKRQASSFADLAAVGGRSYLSRSSGRGDKINAHRVTAGFFAVLGVNPTLGRTFTAEEVSRTERVVVLSHRFWQSRFGGRMDVLTQTIELDDETYSIIGVMPDQNLVWNPALFVPMTFTASQQVDYGDRNLTCIGRLKDGVSVGLAQSELESICQQIGLRHPDTNRGRGGSVRPLLADLTSDARPALFIQLGAVGAVLLIAIVNVSGLLMARACVRRKELSVRAALGAGRGRIMRQMICESLLLAMLGGALGVMVARWSLDGLARLASHYLPRTDQIMLDSRVLGFSAGLVLIAGLGAGFMPALQAVRVGMIEAIRGAAGKATSSRLRSGLVVLQVALTLVLLTFSGLITHSWLKLQQADQGFDVENVHITQFDLGSGRSYDSPQKIANFARAATEAVSALPDVESAALTTGQPMIGFHGLLFQVEGRPEVPKTMMPLTHDAAVTPDYFKVMRIPLRQGRGFEAHDAFGAPRVAIISEELARRHFPGENPVGRRLMVLTMSDQPDAWREIIGVVGDVRPSGPQSELIPHVYEPLAQRPGGTLALAVRSRSSTAVLPTEVNDALGSVDPMLPVPRLRPYRLIVERAWSRQQLTLILFSFFSVAALGLSLIGIYGISAYAVSQRTREIGIRMALGALPRSVARMVLIEGARTVLLGAGVGLIGSFALQRSIRALLYETNPFEPVVFLSVAGLITLAALLGSLLPARRAAKVDPVVALRAE